MDTEKTLDLNKPLFSYSRQCLPRVRHPIDSPKKSVRSPAHAKKALSATADQRTEV